MAVDRHTPL